MSVSQQGTDRLWFDDPRILWRQERLPEFFPNPKLSMEEQMNAVVRLSAYLSLGLYLYTRNASFIYILPFTLLATKVGYDILSRNKPAPRVVQTTQGQGVDAGLPEGNARTAQDGKECVAPTKENPFMNVLLTDIKYDPDRPAACNISDPAIEKSALSNFYDGLFRDVDDVFGRNTNSRQFVTQPLTTLPGAEQREFAELLFGDMGKCKTSGDMNACAYDDVRQRRSPHFEIYE